MSPHKFSQPFVDLHDHWQRLPHTHSKLDECQLKLLRRLHGKMTVEEVRAKLADPTLCEKIAKQLKLFFNLLARTAPQT